jgi:MYXO-CTERM domain-containing protein
MVPLVSAPSTFEANMLAARLGAEGILWELRGVDSVYPGGNIRVLVDEADLDRARDLLLLSEVEAAFEPDADAPPRSHGWLGVLVLALLVALLIARVLGAAIA